MIFTPPLRRLFRHPLFRLIAILFLFCDLLHIILVYRAQAANRQTAHRQTAPPPRNTKRIFIAAQHWNDALLLRERWNDALIALVKELGIENVYVSIYESGSYDDTKGALRELDMALGEMQVQRSVTLSTISREDEISQQPEGDGWVRISSDETARRRIPFLAKLRNQLLNTLVAVSSQGHHFDTVLFLNDVVFTPEDVLRLLDTNGGEYAAACSLDFSKPPAFYDTFALRDSKGHEAIMLTWPYFRSYASRYAAERYLPVPVASCWNGMVAMPVDPFLAQKPLRFRGIPDSLGAAHLEGSECCLIHADNPLSSTHGVFLNPLVQVGYNQPAYETAHAVTAGMSLLDAYMAVWKNRVLRWTTTPVFKEWVVNSRIATWKRLHPDQDEHAAFCIINEMQVLYAKGWRHV